MSFLQNRKNILCEAVAISNPRIKTRVMAFTLCASSSHRFQLGSPLSEDTIVVYSGLYQEIVLTSIVSGALTLLSNPYHFRGLD